MCTLAVLVDQHPRYPVVVAANRDEDPQRPATPPHAWPGRALAAGRDERAGGSWLGVNAAGLLVGITNLWAGPPDPSAPSRGQLLLDLLGEGSLDRLERRLRGGHLPPTNPWNLAAARVGEGALLASSNGQIERRGAGVHVAGNLPLDGRDDRRDGAGRALAEALERRQGEHPQDIVRGLQPVLALHGPGPRHSLCVHGGPRFGTVSSAVVLMAPLLGDSAWWHAPGPPCRTPFAPVPGLLEELAGRG